MAEPTSIQGEGGQEGEREERTEIGSWSLASEARHDPSAVEEEEEVDEVAEEVHEEGGELGGFWTRTRSGRSICRAEAAW